MSSPKITLCVMTCNQGSFLAACLESVLAQRRRPDRLVIADNGSTDATGAVLESFAARHGQRPDISVHRLAYVGGPSALINALAPRLEGEIVVFQAGDDIAEPERVGRLEALFDADPAVLAAHSAVTVIDPAGRIIETLEYDLPQREQARHFARVQGYVLGAGLAIRRRLLDAFPPLDDGAYEDTILPFRAALLGRVGYVPERLVRYRRHHGNVTHALHDISSTEAARRATQLSLARLRHIAKLRRDDLGHLLHRQPERRNELAPLYRVIDASLEEAEVSHALLAPRLSRRLWALRRTAAAGAAPRSLLLALTSALAPGLYLAYRRARKRR
ncbi:MAG TPA: glycosyltransferase [Kiloniellales bacterium]|nr:glycosyltransferase [Kiloniellales bacterium]